LVVVAVVVVVVVVIVVVVVVVVVVPDSRPTFLTAFAPVSPRVPKTVLACSSERPGLTTRTF
jgi:hypothetical protein